MASYQVPQFLDSGEKLFMGLNFRQFGYVLAGSGICILIYFTMQGLFPTLGPYAVVFCIPVALLTIYLAWGKFNGRDSEVYILKLILFLVKPRVLKYIRQPDYNQIEEKVGQKIATKSIANVEKQNTQKDEWENFDYLSEKQKLVLINKLAREIDQNQDLTIRNIEEKNQILEKLYESLGTPLKKEEDDSWNENQKNNIQNTTNEIENSAAPNFFQKND